jgi:hypothetical protein
MTSCWSWWSASTIDDRFTATFRFWPPQFQLSGEYFRTKCLRGTTSFTVIAFPRAPEASIATIALAYNAAHLKKEGCGLEGPATFNPLRGPSRPSSRRKTHVRGSITGIRRRAPSPSSLCRNPLLPRHRAL